MRALRLGNLEFRAVKKKRKIYYIYTYICVYISESRSPENLVSNHGDDATKERSISCKITLQSIVNFHNVITLIVSLSHYASKLLNPAPRIRIFAI